MAKFKNEVQRNDQHDINRVAEYLWYAITICPSKDSIKRDIQLMSCQCMMFIKRGEQNEIYICRIR